MHPEMEPNYSKQRLIFRPKSLLLGGGCWWWGDAYPPPPKSATEHEYLQLTSIYTINKTMYTLCTQLLNMKQRVMLHLRLAYHKNSAIDI